MKLFLPISGNKGYRNLCHEHPSRLGYIIGPSYYQKPVSGISYVLDNDAFKCWKENSPFNADAWLRLLRKVESAKHAPDWVVVPDAVGDKDATLRNWEIYSGMVEYPKAFVLQDGVQIGEVPKADIYFVGGTTQFKWSTAHFWCKHLPRVHVGRVRSRRLLHCERIGAESCDGSGWLRETVRGRPFRQLEAWVMNLNHQFELNLKHTKTITTPCNHREYARS